MNSLSKIIGSINRPAAFFLWIGMTIIGLSGHAQVSGTWSGPYIINNPGYNVLGATTSPGIIQLENYNNAGYGGAAITQTSTSWNPCTSTGFSRCYEVYFDCAAGMVCDGGTNTGSICDQINNDAGGDGASFSFIPSNCSYSTGNIGSGSLGYKGLCSKMLTIEFDTYDNTCNGSIDCNYGGGLSAPSVFDEISLHRDGDETDNGLISGTSTTPGQLEDNLAHKICISYTTATHLLTVSIDGVVKFNYDMTGSSYEPCTYFGSTGLYVSWGAGPNGATNNIIVNDLSSGKHISQTSYVTRTGCAPLPVSFIAFTGRRSNGVVGLDWATASEINNQKFVIERMDGQGDWQDIGEVAGAGNSDSKVQYSYTDLKPLSSKSYYRLKQVDLDGKFAYSNIVDIEDGTGLLVSAVPNPFENALTIGLNETGTYTIQIQDMVGRVVYQDIKENTSGGITLSPAIPAGAYLLTVQNGAGIAQQKIIRK